MTLTPAQRAAFDRFVACADAQALAERLTAGVHRQLVASASKLSIAHVEIYLDLLSGPSEDGSVSAAYIADGLELAEAWLASHRPPHQPVFEAVVRLLSAAGDPIAAKGWWERFLETPEGRGEGR